MDGSASRDRPTSTLHRTLAGVYALALLPVCSFLFLVGGFAASPTICPEVGGSYLCRQPLAQSWTARLIALLLVVSVGLALLALRGHNGRRSVAFLASSVLSVCTAVVVIVVAASSWS